MNVYEHGSIQIPHAKKSGVHVAECPNFGKFGYIRANRSAQLPEFILSANKELRSKRICLATSATKIYHGEFVMGVFSFCIALTTCDKIFLKLCTPEGGRFLDLCASTGLSQYN